MEWLKYFVLFAAFYNICFGLVLHTQNLASSFIYKVIPFFLGLGLLVYAAKILGWF